MLALDVPTTKKEKKPRKRHCKVPCFLLVEYKERKKRAQLKAEKLGFSPKKLVGVMIYEDLIKNRNVFWPKEIPIARRLLEKYPEESFWNSVDFKVKTLAYLYCDELAARLEGKYKIFKLELAPKKVYNIEQKKLGEDKKIDTLGPRTLSEFLNECEKESASYFK